MFFIRRRPTPPARDFPLLLRHEWRIDNMPQIGRLRALAFIAARKKAAQPVPYWWVSA